VQVGDEDVPPPNHDGSDDFEAEFGASSMEDQGLDGPAPSRAAGSSGVRLTYGEQFVRQEQQFRQHDEQALQYRVMFAEEHAGYLRRDQEQCLETVQQRVIEWAKAPLHPGCTVPASRVRVRSWRTVRYCSLIVKGSLQIPLHW
jgi:hypothetical protein